MSTRDFMGRAGGQPASHQQSQPNAHVSGARAFAAQSAADVDLGKRKRDAQAAGQRAPGSAADGPTLGGDRRPNTPLNMLAGAKSKDAELRRRGYFPPWLPRSLLYAAPRPPPPPMTRFIKVGLHAVHCMLSPAARLAAERKGCKYMTFFVALAWAPPGPADAFTVIRACRSIVPIDYFDGGSRDAFEHKISCKEERILCEPPETYMHLPLAGYDRNFHIIFAIIDGCSTLHEAVRHLPPHVDGSLGTCPKRIRRGKLAGRDRTLGSLVDGSLAWTSILPLDGQITPEAVQTGGRVIFRLDLIRRVLRLRTLPRDGSGGPRLPDNVRNSCAFPDALMSQLLVLKPELDAVYAMTAGGQLPALPASRIHDVQHVALHALVGLHESPSIESHVKNAVILLTDSDSDDCCMSVDPPQPSASTYPAPSSSAAVTIQFVHQTTATFAVDTQQDMRCPVCRLQCATARGLVTHINNTHSLVTSALLRDGTADAKGAERGAMISVTVLREEREQGGPRENQGLVYWRGPKLPRHLAWLRNAPARTAPTATLRGGDADPQGDAETPPTPLWRPARFEALDLNSPARRDALPSHPPAEAPARKAHGNADSSAARAAAAAAEVRVDDDSHDGGSAALGSAEADGKDDQRRAVARDDAAGDAVDFERTARLLEGVPPAADEEPSATAGALPASMDDVALMLEGRQPPQVAAAPGDAPRAARAAEKGRERSAKSKSAPPAPKAQKAAPAQKDAHGGAKAAASEDDDDSGSDDSDHVVAIEGKRFKGKKFWDKDVKYRERNRKLLKHKPRYFHHLMGVPLVATDELTSELKKRVALADAVDPADEMERQFLALRLGRPHMKPRQVFFEMLWNMHLVHHRITCDVMVPAVLEHFVRRHAKWLREPQMRPYLVAHMVVLWQRTLIAADHLKHCLLCLEGKAPSAPPLPPADADQAAPAAAPNATTTSETAAAELAATMPEAQSAPVPLAEVEMQA